MSRILAIGSEGNIGAPLVEHLRACGHDVFTTDIRPGWREQFATADINHPLDLLEAFEWRPEVVYLMAAVVSRVTCERSPSLAVLTNVAGTNNILALTRAAGARLVFFSTSEVYGPTDGIMDEATSVPHPNNRYGLTKWLGEQLVAYEAERGLDAVIVRPFMVYGEDEDEGDHRSFMIRCAQHLAEGRPIEVHADTARSWLHVSDAVVGLERASLLTGFHVVNLGHPTLIITEAIAIAMAARLGADPDLIHVVPQPAGMTPVKRPALERQRQLLRMEPTVGIAEGIARVCARFAAAVAA